MTDRITIDPQRNKAVIRGTSIPVRVVVNELVGGHQVQEVAHKYAITPEDVRDAWVFATELI